MNFCPFFYIRFLNRFMHFINNQIDTSDLPKVEELYFEPIESRYSTVVLVNSFLFWLIVLGGLLGIYLFRESEKNDAIMYVVVALIVIAFVQIFTMLKSCQVKSYAIRDKDILYKTGWLFYKEVVVPFNRVQHIEIVRGPIARLFGLSSLKLFTAGGQQSDLKIPGLFPAKAQRIKEIVSQKIRKDEEE